MDLDIGVAVADRLSEDRVREAAIGSSSAKMSSISSRRARREVGRRRTWPESRLGRRGPRRSVGDVFLLVLRAVDVVFGLAEDNYDGPEYQEEYVPDSDEDLDGGRDSGQVRRLPTSRRARRDEIDGISADDEPIAASRMRVLRPVGTGDSDVQVHLVIPRNFNDAQQVADEFKRKFPAILNLQTTDHELSKRMIDFSPGLTYAPRWRHAANRREDLPADPAQRRSLSRGEGTPPRKRLLQPVLTAPAAALTTFGDRRSARGEHRRGVFDALRPGPPPVDAVRARSSIRIALPNSVPLVAGVGRRDPLRSASDPDRFEQRERAQPFHVIADHEGAELVVVAAAAEDRDPWAAYPG